jgi:CheY-like chemotaxis protein
MGSGAKHTVGVFKWCWWGEQVQVVDTGAAVLAAMRTAVFDIILLDIHMPVVRHIAFLELGWAIVTQCLKDCH